MGQTLGHYRILEQIGAGGMGVVYRAHDESLDRDVALKVLPADSFQDETARARLLREARTASQLNHPHICTIHEVGEADGHAFIAMELVEGNPLSMKLLSGPLPAAEVVRLGLQLAEALAHAHDRGIVHRDLKAANVVITPEGRAKVLDFGLAKRMTADGTGDTATQSQVSLTQPGSVVGTLAYMAPEQLRGQPADTRSDVWALGAVIYEMATGARPFQGQTGFELSSAIMNRPPAPMAGKIPIELKAVVERCLEKEPGRRYQRGGELQAALEAIQTGTTAPWTAMRYHLARGRWIGLGVSMLVLFAVAAGNLDWLRSRLPGGSPAAAHIESLAVLPLENLSGDPEQAYLADGMHEALITELGKLSGLRRVTARSSVLRYQKTDKALAQIARELGVDAVVTGSVLRSGDRVRITAHLIRGSTEEQVWSDGYERELRDVLALQNELVGAITREIRLQLTPEEKARLATARPVNPEAYKAYLQGRFHFAKLSREELDTAERYFQLALEKDPNSALAYVGLSDVWLVRSDAGFLPPRETMAKGKSAALRALELDDTVAEAHVSLANILALSEWDWAGGEKEFRRALELDPNNARAHFMYSDFLISTKRTQEWRAEIQRALELDPLNYFYQCFYGWHLVYLRRYDEAIAEFGKVTAAQPDFSSAHMGLWGAFYKKKMDAEALAEAKKFFEVLGDREVVEALERGYARAGYRGAMKNAADKLAERAKRKHVPAIRTARLYAHAGEKARALEWLETAYQRGESPLGHLGVAWDWDDLRPDPRFQNLMRRINLPP